MKKTSLFTILTALLVMFLPMQMLAAWEYSANGNVLSAYGESGYTAENPLSITISAPADLQFDGNYKPATLSNTTAWTAAGLTVPTILYNGKTNAPSMLGTYTASISAGGATAEVVYTIKTVIDFQSFFNNGITQGHNFDVDNTGTHEVGLNNTTQSGVWWNSEENCAIFDGQAYLQIANPLGSVNANTGFTLTTDVWISSNNNYGYPYYRYDGVHTTMNGWQRLFDLSDGNEQHCIYLNAGSSSHLGWDLRLGYEGEAYTPNNTGNTYWNQWCTITLVVAPGGYTTLYVNGTLLTHSSSGQISTITTVLNNIHNFNVCYIGTSIFEAAGINADGYFIGKIRGFQTAKGALMPYFDGVDYHYLLSYATNGGDPIIGTFEATIPASLPTPTHPNPAAVFQGWFMDEDLTIPVTTGITLTKNTALYAKWTITNYILTDIPEGWTVTANGQTVPVTPNYTDSPMGSAIIPGGASVVLTPPDSVKPRVKNIDLLTPEQIPLTFEAKTEGATVTFGGIYFDDPEPPTVEYSLNDGAWTTYTSAITLTNVGDKVSFRGNNTTYYYNYQNYHFSCSEDCYLYGNIMSLVDSTGYADNKTLTSNYAFQQLFYNNAHIVNHPSKTLVLPATTLTSECYSEMFSGCTGLTSAPELPAATLAFSCYSDMFYGCTSLTTAPELPSTTLANSCYCSMFYGCTSLESAPALPATTLVTNCYKSMFYGCTSLTTAPTLPATSLANNCYDQMFYNCTSLTTAPALPALSLAYSCYHRMFYGCTNLATAPALPATTLASYCYQDMFSYCTSLETAPALPATSIADHCYSYMFSHCTSLATVPNLPATTMATYCYEAMFRVCTSLATAPALPATTLALDCYREMFYGCTSLATAPALPATTLATCCYYQMFSGCTSLETAPALPATSLASSCYYQMFYGCTSLETAPTLPATSMVASCYEAMFRGCTSLSTAPALSATTLANRCYYQMFSGCTSLTTAPALPATTLASSCYCGMFHGCTNLTTVPELHATTLVSECYSSMFYNCSNLNSVTCLATNISASGCTSYWLYGVATSGTFTKAESTDWSGKTGASGIPSGWITIPVIPGAFSVSSTKKVYFAPGNLQYQASTNTWQFAEHQYTNIGASNSNISSSYSGWIDLFGWGTSGYNHGAVCYQPWSSSMTNTDYYPYGSATANLYDGDGKADWGYNAISNGGNTENCGWRTLKKDEWLYLFNSRATPSGIRYAKARVNGVDGIILLPDDWSTTYYSLTNTNVGNAAWTSNTITAYDWTNQLEAHGAVFFPVSGNRDGAHSPSSGFVSCWSSDYQAGNSNNAHVVYIPGDSVNPDAPGQRSTGNPVRLVRDVK